MRTTAMQFLTYVIVFSFSLTALAAENTFESVWKKVISDPYAELPQYEVSKEKFGPGKPPEQNLLLRDAERTLRDDADFASWHHGHKLFQPNGICFSGRWQIDTPSTFTGLFSNGTDIPAIVRVSVMLSGTTQADKRALGMAIKLFPPDQSASENILVMESMGGKYLTHVTDAVLDNHPTLGNIPKIADIGVLLRIRKDLKSAIKLAETDEIKLRYLPLMHIATSTLADGEQDVSPYWIRFQASGGTPKIDAQDFRDELRLEHYPDGVLSFAISVAGANAGSKSKAEWDQIGRLELTAYTISATCDTALHFKHHGTKSLQR